MMKTVYNNSLACKLAGLQLFRNPKRGIFTHYVPVKDNGTVPFFYNTCHFYSAVILSCLLITVASFYAFFLPQGVMVALKTFSNGYLFSWFEPALILNHLSGIPYVLYVFGLVFGALTTVAVGIFCAAVILSCLLITVASFYAFFLPQGVMVALKTFSDGYLFSWFEPALILNHLSGISYVLYVFELVFGALTTVAVGLLCAAVPVAVIMVFILYLLLESKVSKKMFATTKISTKKFFCKPMKIEYVKEHTIDNDFTY